MLKSLCGPLGPGPIAVGFDGMSPCFSSLVLDSIPVAFLLFYFWPQCQLIYRRREVHSLVDQPISYWVQIMSCFLMTIFPILSLFMHAISVNPEDVYTYVYPYEVFAQMTQFIAWLNGLFIVWLANMYGVKLNYGIRLWWITNFVVSCKDAQLQSMRSAQGKDIASLLIVTCIRLLVSAVLALDSFASLMWGLSRFWKSRSARPYIDGIDDFHHPWLQANHEATPRRHPLSDRQIWNTWLGSRLQANAMNSSLTLKPRHVNALNLLSWFEGIDVYGEPYVQFSVEVDPVDPGERKWVFSSSFSDWIWLERALKKGCDVENIPCSLPVFPVSIKGYPAAELASILQVYFQYAPKCLSIQTPLAEFLQCQTKLHYVEKESHASPFASFEPTTMQLGPTASVTSSPKSVEFRGLNVRQKISEVIASPIAAILERKIRPPSEEVVLFQTKDQHEKIICANVVQCNVNEQPIQFELYVSTGTSSWSVRRRFKQFLQLHSKLQCLFDDRLIPARPSRSLITSHHSRFLENRCRQLDIFIQSLVSSDYFECRPLYDFLCAERIECSESLFELINNSKAHQVHKFEIIISKWYLSDDINEHHQDPKYYFEVYEYFSSNQFLKWTISRALSDFQRLHASLKQRFPNDALPDLLKWSSVQASTDPTFADAFASQLELFLQKLINCAPFSCPEINAFLELDNGNRHISTGMHSVSLS